MSPCILSRSSFSSTVDRTNTEGDVDELQEWLRFPDSHEKLTTDEGYSLSHLADAFEVGVSKDHHKVVFYAGHGSEPGLEQFAKEGVQVRPYP